MVLFVVLIAFALLRVVLRCSLYSFGAVVVAVVRCCIRWALPVVGGFDVAFIVVLLFVAFTLPCMPGTISIVVALLLVTFERCWCRYAALLRLFPLLRLIVVTVTLFAFDCCCRCTLFALRCWFTCLRSLLCCCCCR